MIFFKEDLKYIQGSNEDYSTELNYVTKGISLPSGKPKVFLCCHPDDQKIYFEKIIDDILKVCNCSIWYTKKTDSNYKSEISEYIKEMKCFVILVTQNLLCKPNEILKIEFETAYNNMIPILPIVLEEGIEEVFDKQYKNLHSLKAYINNKSYLESLKSYLSTLFDFTASENIFSAFEGMIFMSYRRKDNNKVRELIKSIHNHEKCRDIAIWYDDFLAVGEDFNDSIKKELEKSDLFLLAVTPNVIEPKTDPNGNQRENYIITEEYPLAKKMKKEILPVMVEYISPKLIEQKFEKISDCFCASVEELSDWIAEFFGKKSVDIQNWSAEKLYLLGLAYLNGTYAEVDYERAVEFMTKSAEKGYISALKKLINMYEYGIGVICDKKKAIEWTKKLIEIKRKEADEINVFEEHLSVLSTTMKLTDLIFFEKGLEESFDELIQQVKECFEELEHYISLNVEQINLEGAIQRQVFYLFKVEWLAKIANILCHKKEYERAEQMLFEAEQIIMSLFNEDYENPDFRYLKVLKDAEIFVFESHESFGILYDIAQIFGTLADIELRRKNYEKALEYYEKQKDFSNKSCKIFPQEELNWMQLSEAIAGMAWCQYILNGNYEEAIPQLNMAIRIIERLYNENSSDFILARWAYYYQCIARIYGDQKKFVEAEESINKSIKMNLALVNEQNLNIYKINLEISMGIALNLLQEKKASHYTISDIKNMLIIWENTGKKEQQLCIEEKLDEVYKLLHQQIEVDFELERFERAGESMNICIEIRELFARITNQLAMERLLGQEYILAANYFSIEDMHDEAIKYLKSAVECYRNIFFKTNSSKDFNVIRKEYLEMGKIYLKTGQIRLAINCLLKYWTLLKE